MVFMMEQYLLNNNWQSAVKLSRKLLKSPLPKEEKENIRVLSAVAENKTGSKAAVEQLMANADRKTFLKIAMAYDRMGMPLEAINALDKGLRTFPQDPELYMLMGIILTNQEQLDTALRIMEVAHQVHPDDQRFAQMIEGINKLKKKMSNPLPKEEP